MCVHSCLSSVSLQSLGSFPEGLFRPSSKADGSVQSARKLKVSGSECRISILPANERHVWPLVNTRDNSTVWTKISPKEECPIVPTPQVRTYPHVFVGSKYSQLAWTIVFMTSVGRDMRRATREAKLKQMKCLWVATVPNSETWGHKSSFAKAFWGYTCRMYGKL